MQVDYSKKLLTVQQMKFNLPQQDPSCEVNSGWSLRKWAWGTRRSTPRPPPPPPQTQSALVTVYQVEFHEGQMMVDWGLPNIKDNKTSVWTGKRGHIRKIPIRIPMEVREISYKGRTVSDKQGVPLLASYWHCNQPLCRNTSIRSWR